MARLFVAPSLDGARGRASGFVRCARGSRHVQLYDLSAVRAAVECACFCCCSRQSGGFSFIVSGNDEQLSRDGKRLRRNEPVRVKATVAVVRLKLVCCACVVFALFTCPCLLRWLTALRFSLQVFLAFSRWFMVRSEREERRRNKARS